MIPTTTNPETLLIELPKTIALQVTLEQFTTLATLNRDLQLERTSQRELIVNPPAGWETGKRNRRLTAELRTKEKRKLLL